MLILSIHPYIHTYEYSMTFLIRHCFFVTYTCNLKSGRSKAPLKKPFTLGYTDLTPNLDKFCPRRPFSRRVKVSKFEEENERVLKYDFE